MDGKYYSIPREELGKDAKIPLQILTDKEALFRVMADGMTDEIIRNNNAGKRTVMILPVGPIGQYPLFVKTVNEKRISLKDVWFINMDEYLNDDGTYIAIDNKLSFRGFMDRTVYTKIDPELVMPEAQRVFPDPEDPGRILRLIEELGGVDVCFGGIGINGHVAFNEADPDMSAGEYAKTVTRVLPVSRETRTVNAIGDLGGAVDMMPNLCITVGMCEILSAKKIRLGVFRDWHRAVVRRAAYGEMTGAFPVSLLQQHEDVCIFMTQSVAESAL